MSSRASPAERYALLEQLAIPAAVVKGNQVLHANVRFAGIFGLTVPEILTRHTDELVETANPANVDAMLAVRHARVAGQDPTSRYWVSLRPPGQLERTYDVRLSKGSAEDEFICLFVEMEPQDRVQRLTDALSRTSWDLVALREEGAVLECAVASLASQGFSVVTFLITGNEFLSGPSHQTPEMRAALEAAWGVAWPELRLPQSELPTFATCLARRCATFDPDTQITLDRRFAPDIVSNLKRYLPKQAANAPIFVGDAALAVISIQRDQLLPGEVGAFELFIHRVGSAIENVRHHRRARERLDELEQLQRELVEQERLATLGEAAAVLAHEVKNPVGAILNAAAVLRKQGADANVRQQILGMMEEEATRLDRLVDDLLHLGRPMQPEMQTVDLRLIAERALQSLRWRKPPHAVNVRLEGNALALGDTLLLERALDNLLDNAARVTPPGGEIVIRLSQTHDRAVLQVDDQGPGISPERAQKIFEPFFTTYASGTGLGLAIVRRAMEVQHGSVTATASPSGGSRFQLELPAPSSPD